MTAQDAVHPPTPQSCANEGLAGNQCSMTRYCTYCFVEALFFGCRTVVAILKAVDRLCGEEKRLSCRCSDAAKSSAMHKPVERLCGEGEGNKFRKA